jgi:RHS repeat-associated protein
MTNERLRVLRLTFLSPIFLLALPFIAWGMPGLKHGLGDHVSSARKTSQSEALVRTSSLGATKAAALQKYDLLPLGFEPNEGQTDPPVRYIARGNGYTVFLTNRDAVLSLQQACQPQLPPFVQKLDSKSRRRFDGSRRGKLLLNKYAHCQNSSMRIVLDGASMNAHVQPLEALPGKINYFLGRDRSKWRTDIPTYRRITYTNIYPHTDLVYYGNHHQLEFDFVIAPGGDPNSIKLGFVGQGHLHIDVNGDLRLGSLQHQLVLHRPSIYQIEHGKKHIVRGTLKLFADGQVGFSIDSYNRREPLVVDPVLAYSTYLDGSNASWAEGVAVDINGDAYVVGTTSSTDFPIVNGYQTTDPASSLAFVAEFDPTGSRLLYSTFLGGSGYTSGSWIAVDPTGNAYVTGLTESTDFPVVNGFQSTNNSPAPYGTAFITRINPALTGTASLVYSSYLGGGGDSFSRTTSTYSEAGFGIAVDSHGRAYVTGETSSDMSVAPFPTTANAYQSTLKSPYGNAFLTVVDTNQSGAASLAYSTYLGGDGGTQNLYLPGDYAFGVAADSNGNAYVTGTTTSDASGPFPTTPNAYQSALKSSNGNGFLTEIATTQSGAQSLVYSTYFGGSTTNEYGDGASEVALDSLGNVYVDGYALSSDFPVTPGAFQTTNSTNGKGFVAKFDLTKSGAQSLVYSTFLGGTNEETTEGIIVDNSGDALVTGVTWSTDFPTTSDAFQSTLKSSGGNPFLTYFTSDGSALRYSTYIGGSGSSGQYQYAYAVALDSSGNAYIAGFTESSDFPTTAGSFQPTVTPNPDSAFVAKFSGFGGPSYVTGNMNACTATSCAVNLSGTGAGNLIVLGLFVGDSTTVSSVTDTQGNTYTLISSSTWSPSGYVEKLYYAKNIAGGADTITVTLSGSKYMELHAYDYSGLDTSSPLDTYSTNTGLSVTTGTSGNLTTTNANDLLFGFFHSDNGVTNTAGTGYTPRTFSGDGYPLGEDKYVTSTGTYSATMSFSLAADYVGFLVAFKGASGGGGSSPAITSLSPTSGAVGTSVTITGSNFGSTQGSSTVKFNGTAATVTSWSATSIVVPVPFGATTGNVVVTVSGLASNGVSFTVIGGPAYVTGDTTSCGGASCSANLTGTHAGDLIVLGLFVGDSTSVSSVSDTQGNTYTLISSSPWPTPSGFFERLYYAKNIVGGADTITVTLGGSVWGMELHVYDYSGLDTSSPLDASATPQTGTSTSGVSGTLTTTNPNDLLFSFFHSDNGVTNTAGTGFTGRTPPGDSYPLGEDKNATSTGTYSATMNFSASADYVGFLVAFKAASGGGGSSPSITSLSPTSGAVGTSVTITGSNFGSTQGSSTVKFNGTTATPTSWSATSIVAPIPSGATTGPVVVTVGGVASNNDHAFTVTGPAPTIDSLSPNSGPATTLVSIYGSNFGSTQGSSTVKFGGIATNPTSWSDTTIVAPVPAGAQTGNVTVTVNGVASNGEMFTVPTGTNVYYYLDDMLGSARVITTSAGAVCYDADFYPFGGERVVTDAGTCDQDYKFEGKERDTETGNDNFGARYYSNRLGRWLSADWSWVPAPVPYANMTNPQTLNLYAMVSDNPESFVDLDGHYPGGEPSAGQVGVPEANPQPCLNDPKTNTSCNASGSPDPATSDALSTSTQQQVNTIRAQAQQQITVNLNVIYDQDAKLTGKDKATFGSMLKETEGLYGKIGIGFNVTYTFGSRVTDMGGMDVDVGGAKKSALNVFVSSSLTVAEVGATGDNGASTRLQGNAVSFIGIGGPHWVLSHELAHQFLGDTKHPPGFFSNLFRDTYINHFILPHVTSYGAELRKGAVDFVGP